MLGEPRREARPCGELDVRLVHHDQRFRGEGAAAFEHRVFVEQLTGGIVR